MGYHRVVRTQEHYSSMVIITIEAQKMYDTLQRTIFAQFTAEDDSHAVLDSQKVQQNNGVTNVYTNVKALTDACCVCMGNRNCFTGS